MRGIIINSFVENQELFGKIILIIIWPNKYLKIKKYIFELNQRYNEYIEIFLQHAELYRSYFKEVKFYANNGKWNKNYYGDLEKYKDWSKKWFQALNNYVFVLNKLIEVSNKYFSDINEFPETFRTKKLLNDSLGIYNEDEKSFMWLPINEDRKNTNGT